MTGSAALSANAESELISQPYTYINTISTSGQWSIFDNYTIYKRISDPPRSNGGFYPQYVVFSGSAHSYDLEYYVAAYEYNTNRKIFESDWCDNNKQLVVGGMSRTSSKGVTYAVYVRRKADENGDRGYLVPSDMNPSSFAQVGTLEYQREIQTLPSEWYDNTTQTAPTLTTQTTVSTVDQTAVESGLQIPRDVVNAFTYFSALLDWLFSLKYVTFLVCFGLLFALGCWLLH